MPEKTCEWKLIPDEISGEIWGTNCENLFQFEDGGPKDNGFKFCPYCGCQLMVIEDPEEEGEEVEG